MHDQLPPLSISSQQLALELEMAETGINRYRSAQTKAMAGGRVSVTTPGRRLLMEVTKEVGDEVEKWMQEANDKPGPRSQAMSMMLKLDPYNIAALGIQAMMDGHGRKRSTVVCGIATLMRDEALMGTLRDQHPPRFEALCGPSVPRHHRVSVARRWLKEDLWHYDEPLRHDQMQAALVVFEMVLRHAGLFRVESVQARTTVHAIVVLTEETLKWIERSHEANEALKPLYLPMVDVPLDWGPDRMGGYRSGAAKRKSLCRVQRRSHIEELKQADMPIVYRSINLAQRTQWRVSQDVLEVATYLWDNNARIAGLPDRDEPEFPERPTDETALKAWKATKTAALSRFRSDGSSRLRHARTLAMATKFSGQSFYMPHFIDFRGRLYPVPPWLTHQGPDFAKGLLQFERSCRVAHGTEEAELFLKTGADLWKGDLDHAMVRAVAQDPLDCLEWSHADKPWQFLAWCLDAGPWLDDQDSPLRVPVHSDGSNNGLQIYSLLMRSKELARATNVSPGPKSDLYQKVADQVWARVQVDPSALAAQWRAFLPKGLPREATKRPVMTWPYGVQKHSGMKYMREWLMGLERERGERPWGKGNWKACQYLTDILWEEIQVLIGPAVACMDWLRELAEACNGPVRWTTPAGLPVRQDYPKVKRVRVRAAINDTVKYVRFRQRTSETSKREQKNGLPPNFVHSLDSAALMLTMDKAANAGIQDFAMVHDSYGCPADQAPLLGRILREVFSEMFSENLLDSFRAEVIMHNHEADIPATPQLGDLDPSVVTTSTHFFG